MTKLTVALSTFVNEPKMAGCVAACHHGRHILCCKVDSFAHFLGVGLESKELNDRRSVCAGNKRQSFRNATDILACRWPSHGYSTRGHCLYTHSLRQK
jgi:hypothetical protein